MKIDAEATPVQILERKDNQLRKERGIGFETIIAVIEAEGIDATDHPNPQKYPGQKMYLLEMDGYMWVVPHVHRGNEIFLKTAYPSRKVNKHYIREQ